MSQPSSHTSTSTPAMWLHHAEFGELPARRLVDCVFALAPNGRILHFHIEQVDMNERDGELHLSVNGNTPDDSRAHCQVIPPFVTQFPRREAS